ncbi:MAG TPA: zf-HC2 domain-containing protein [Gemmatimonadaceae bacterium]|nr:zf-HC2 domain-containing protein [Gemmatimonadaceae bacterium]
MSCDELALTLAEYMDGDVDDATRERVEAHARSCGECGGLIVDLERLRVAARSLPDLVPGRELWSGISARIETPIVELKNNELRGRHGRHPMSVARRRWWTGVAAAALVVVTATVTHTITARSIGAPVAAAPSNGLGGGSHPATIVPVVARVAGEARYDREITRLRAVLESRRPQLDSATIAVVEHNLAVIDEAIAQCTQALQRDPGSRYLMESLRDQLDSKVQLLRTAAALPARS